MFERAPQALALPPGRAGTRRPQGQKRGASDCGIGPGAVGTRPGRPACRWGPQVEVGPGSIRRGCAVTGCLGTRSLAAWSVLCLRLRGRAAASLWSVAMLLNPIGPSLRASPSSRRQVTMASPGAARAPTGALAELRLARFQVALQVTPGQVSTPDVARKRPPFESKANVPCCQ
jgi:hypothetical protein